MDGSHQYCIHFKEKDNVISLDDAYAVYRTRHNVEPEDPIKKLLEVTIVT